jgi:uncharacterized protein YqgV (UPF0045/DUF77 family)
MATEKKALADEEILMKHGITTQGGGGEPLVNGRWENLLEAVKEIKEQGIIEGFADGQTKLLNTYLESFDDRMKQAKSEGIKIGENIGFGQGRKFTEDRLWDFISGKTKKDPTTAFTSGKSRDIAWEFQRSKQIGEDNLKKRLLNDED